MLELNLDISEIFSKFPAVVRALLMDNTTKKNIIWATDNYESKGKGFSPEDHITPEHLTGKEKVIKPRTEKSKTEQAKRSRDSAEVFTPCWIVNKQNNLVDSAWFGCGSPFNAENEDNTWSPKEKVVFGPEKSWRDYVTDVRLEACCGEAPYLVSRYDTVTGKPLEKINRVGLLDRKMRVVGENAADDKDWIDCATQAMKSLYGYEFQGDNLLIARENMLLGFLDYYAERFGDLPDEQLVLEIAEIVSWNLWQMDGIKCVVPFSCHNKAIQYSIFGDPIEEKATMCEGCQNDDPSKHNGQRCYIMDWEKNKRIKFVSLMWRNGTYVG